jgi:PAS domain S-box-containing protein
VSTKKLLQNRSKLERAWQDFFSNGVIDRRILRPEIADSWERSRDAGVDPDGKWRIEELDAEGLEVRRERLGEVLKIAKPFMETLYKAVGESNMILRLTDEDGWVLSSFGDQQLMETHQSLKLHAGSNVREDVIGTNGIGISLVADCSIQVMGAEHYHGAYHDWTTSASPIHDEEGRIIAVISMSGDYNLVHPHTLGMVMASAEAIEHELQLEHAHLEVKRASEHYLAIMESIREGILCIDASGVISEINHFARKFLGFTDKELLGQSVRLLIEPVKFKNLLSVIRNASRLEEVELFLTHKNGKKSSVLINLTPVSQVGSERKEAVLTFRESKRVHHLVNKIVGSNAIYTFGDILGESREIKMAIDTARRVADSDATVLLHGESGTGKEMFAQGIHNSSRRKNQPFVFINCGAIPRDLVASELFGYVEGAFTGARKGGQPGKFELSDGGTLFLDEIGDMPLDTQAMLLRVLETRQVVRVGGHDVLPVDVRVIAATHKDLKSEVDKGNFRSDLYYRLNVMPIHTPALRERRRDIPKLIDNFYHQFNKSVEVKPHIEEGFYKVMSAYDWPGNVRELQNVMQMMVSMAGDAQLKVELVPDYIRSELAETSDEVLVRIDSLEVVEKRVILNALEVCKGNVVHAAKALGIGRATLYRKMELYNLSLFRGVSK